MNNFLNSIFERADSNAANLDQLNALLDAIKPSFKKEKNDIKNSLSKETKNFYTFGKDIIDKFWKGDCLNGGTGYWKHEVCFGTKVFNFNFINLIKDCSIS